MNKLVATTLESSINVYDLRTQHPTKGFTSLTEKVCASLRHCVDNFETQSISKVYTMSNKEEMIVSTLSLNYASGCSRKGIQQLKADCVCGACCVSLFQL